MIWTTEYLNRVALEGENEIAQELQCIIDRLSFATNVNQSQFQLPDYVFNVKSVYWKGYRLEPIKFLDITNIGYDIITFLDGAFNAIAFNPAYLLGSQQVETISGFGARGGKPREYFYSGFGENILKINPGSNEILELYSNQLWSANIEKALIVEFYRFADPENGWKIPHYIRKRLIKTYVMMKAFQKEGDGQNLKAAKYYTERFVLQLARAKRIIDRVKNAYVPIAPTQYYCSDYSQDYGYQGKGNVARPVLPSNYGITVEDWE